MMAADSQSEPIQAEAAPVRAIRGKYAHVLTSSDAFARKKREEIARKDTGLDDGRTFHGVQWTVGAPPV